MTWWTFWESVAVLRRIEFVTLLITMGVPLLSGTVLLTLRHRIKTLQHDSVQHQGAYFDDKVNKLEEENHALTEALEHARRDLGGLRRITAPRQLSTYQEDLLLEKLRGIHAAPVTIAAYAFEEESAAYATQIATVLRKAGWDVTLSKTSMNDFKGLSLVPLSRTHQTVPGLHELSQALSEAEVETHPRTISTDSIAGQLQDNSILVVVGRK